MVEHSLGKGEVTSSSLVKGFLKNQVAAGLDAGAQSRDATRLTYDLEQAWGSTSDGIERFHPDFGDLKVHFAALAGAQR